MGIFKRLIKARKLEEANKHLGEMYVDKVHRIAELEELVEMYKEDKATKQRIIETQGENARKLRIRCKKQQNIINGYKEKYGDLDPKKEEKPAPQPTPLPESKERKQDHDPFIEE